MASNHTFASANRRHVRHKPSGCTFIAAAVRGLHLVCPAGLLLDLLRQSLVSRSNFLHHLPSLRVAHRLGLGKDFLGACSPLRHAHAFGSVSAIKSVLLVLMTSSPLSYLTLANSLAGAYGGLLADAITITCSVRRHINMQVICVRRVSARTKHGREPSACRSPDRVEDVSHRFITVWLYGNEFAT